MARPRNLRLILVGSLHKNNFLKWALFGSILAATFLLSSAGSAHAAGSLYISPPTGTFTVDSTFTVSIYVNTGGQYINAVQADLTFPPDKLQVVSPTTGKSIFQIWVAQPTFSNVDGTMRFRGTIPTPGIQTDAGLISTVTFRVKETGTAVVKIADTSKILLNDGRGTDILGGETDGIYYLTLPPPAGPVVVSPTNPDQEKWYESNNVVFRWIAAPDSQGFSYVLNNFPVDEPDEISEGTRTYVSYQNLPDGIYYFHIKGLRAGVWGGVTNYALKIDNSPPAAFDINISPSNRSSNQRPIFDFLTTDAVSGIDHYELKIIPLDLPAAQSGGNATPFFIEATSPYSRELSLGRYDIVVRAYDAAGNYYQTTKRFSVVTPLFEVVVADGIRIGGVYTVSWPYVAVSSAIFLLLMLYLARRTWIWHRKVEHQLEAGAHEHPAVAQKIQELKQKQQEYPGTGPGTGTLITKAIIIFFAVVFSMGIMTHKGFAADVPTLTPPVEPPVVSLFPSNVSNDEIFYIGGRAVAPNAQVLIYLQNVETGSTFSGTVITDKTGAWFYSFPEFLSPGKYIVWTQLKIHDALSPPSSKLDLNVAPTAIQIGSNRLSYQDFYFVLLLVFVLIVACLLTFILYHTYHFRIKNKRLIAVIKEAEESVRRGFALVRRDIESELDMVRQMKQTKELSAEEKRREEKLLKDLEDTNGYIGSEIWKIEEADKEIM